MDEKASNVAFIMLCGLDVPIDFATTSCTPKASNGSHWTTSTLCRAVLARLYPLQNVLSYHGNVLPSLRVLLPYSFASSLLFL